MLKYDAKSKLGWFLIAALSLVPAIIWATLSPLGTRFGSMSVAFTSLGQLAGLVGMAMFALNLVLSGRFKFLEDYFGGLNQVYIAHQLFGGLAFSLMLFHPLFLAGKYLLVSTRSAALFLLPSGDWPLNFGIFALSLLMVLLVLTFFARPAYERWKYTHKFLGFAFFLAGLHGFLMPSDISRSLPLKSYMLALATAGLATYGYRTILGFVLIRKQEYAVSGIRQLGNIVEIEMSPKKEPLGFVPGQFVFASFQNIGPEAHPFSITAAKSGKNLKIAAKDLGDFTSKLKGLTPGTPARIEGPFGRFFSQTRQEQIWIAGGIGITPFLSMARSPGEDRKAYLFYCTANESEAVFLKELSEIAANNKNLIVVPYFSEEQGRITTEYIEKKSGGLKGKEIFVCGPLPMMKSLKSQLLKLGIPAANIHSEEFQL